MGPRMASSVPRRIWQCPQCRQRVFSTSTSQRAFGPEHPRFIEVPEPPQQNLPYHPFIKGRLPVPRNVLAGKDGLKKADDDQIAKSTPLPQKPSRAVEGSREAWKAKISEARRRNLREGLQGLRARKIKEQNKEAERQRLDKAVRTELLNRPEREDERLTAPSHGLDLEKLLHGPLEDPTREARLAAKARNVELHTAAKRADRLDHLHTLYMNARSFIVTPEQLDQAIEEEFNKDFRALAGTGSVGDTNSMWAFGEPMTVQEMLNRANRSGRMAVDSGPAVINRERIRKIAEKLTGGKMENDA